MKTLNIDTLSAEAAESVLTVLDLISQLDDTVLIQKGERPLYTLSKVDYQSQVEETDERFPSDMKPSEIFDALADKFDAERLDEIEQRRHSIKTL